MAIKEEAMKRQIKKMILRAFIFLSFIGFGCSGGTEIQSTVNNNDIKIDGSSSDWGTSLNYVKDDNIAFGFKNDNENLYIGIVTSDKTKIMRILSMGLTVWFDAGKDKLGIRFPLRPEPGEMQNVRMQQNGEEPPESGERIKNAIAKRTDLQIINKDELPLYTDRADKGPDFIAKLGYDNDQLVYELKIPLANNKLAERIFNTGTGKVEINFVTGKFEMGNFPGNKPGGNFGGARPHSGNMGGNRPPRERMNFEPLDYTFDVKLTK